jgi:integrase
MRRYFLNLVTGMRISEVVAIEMEKRIKPDCSIIYVRQQLAKDMNALKPDLKTEAGLRDIDLHPDAARILHNFIGSRKSGFLFQTAHGTMLDPAASTGTARVLSRKKWCGMKPERGSTCSGDSERPCCNLVRRGKS